MRWRIDGSLCGDLCLSFNLVCSHTARSLVSGLCPFATFSILSIVIFGLQMGIESYRFPPVLSRIKWESSHLNSTYKFYQILKSSSFDFCLTPVSFFFFKIWFQIWIDSRVSLLLALENPQSLYCLEQHLST